jgi:hypothetical protein
LVDAEEPRLFVLRVFVGVLGAVAEVP